MRLRIRSSGDRSAVAKTLPTIPHMLGPERAEANSFANVVRRTPLSFVEAPNDDLGKETDEEREDSGEEEDDHEEHHWGRLKMTENEEAIGDYAQGRQAEEQAHKSEGAEDVVRTRRIVADEL